MTDVTVITATLNRLKMLQDAVSNVRQQRIPSLEHLIVDGGSNDGTPAWVGQQPDLTLLSGPDLGVYDAWNKGVAAANGEVIGFLNSDDRYFPDAVSKALQLLAEAPNCDAVCGAHNLVEHGSVVTSFHRPTDVVPNLRVLFLGNIGINAHFFRRECLRRLGKFSLDYPLCSDRDMLIRFKERGCVALGLDGFVYSYLRHDSSLTFDRALKRQAELRRELLAIAQAWQGAPDASVEARRLARVLEGRSRFGLARLAIARRDWTILLEASSRKAASARPISSLASALADLILKGVG